MARPSFKTNNLFIVVLLLAALIIVVVSFWSAKMNLGRKAVGSSIVRLTITSPSGASFKPGDTFSVVVNLISTQTKQVRVAGTDISFNPNVFNIESVACNANTFPSVAKATSQGGIINLSCYKPAGAFAQLSANQPVALGTITLKVKDTAPPGTARLAFIRTRIPEAGTSVDISDEGAGLNLTIIGSGLCSLKGSGDANCDDKITISDFMIWRDEFLSGNGRRSDFDGNSVVNVRDFLTWRTGFLRNFR